MEHNDAPFSYTYCAKRQEEIRCIRQKYTAPEEDRLEQLRRLDRSADRPGRIAAMAVGVLGALLFGVGLCCATVWTDYFAPGVAVGVAGLAGVCMAYPIYRAMGRHRRRKLAPEILRISQELLDREG